MKVSFLGFLVSENDIENILHYDKYMPIQTHKFGWNFVKKLKMEGIMVNAISSPPVSSFPKNKSCLINPEKNIKGVDVFGFINIFPLNFIQRFVKSFYKLKKNNDSIVIVHGLYLPYIAAACMYSITTKVSLIVVLTDPVSVKGNGIIYILRTINSSFLRLLLKRFSLSFSLSSELSDKYMKNKPTMIFPGFTKESAINLNNSLIESNSCTFNLCYAGGLEVDYGVLILINAFIKLQKINNSKKITLYICGKGTLSTAIKELSDKYTDIKFLGLLLPTELNELYKKSDLLVNPRPSNSEMSRLSFPSKLFEYIDTSVPVVTTRLSTIPIEILECFYYFDDESIDGLVKKISQLSKYDKKDLRLFGESSKIKLHQYINSLSFKQFIKSNCSM